jgi:hypothetical protein
VNEQHWATIVGFLVFVGLRILDYLAPRGRHMRFVDRYTTPDDDKREDEKG